ncbi:MAG: hypothetical protein OSB74_05350, partial [Verrucomicrobiota bacterium]|nr:hypothetical protein [Verrucomicrobiota bacterium]
MKTLGIPKRRTVRQSRKNGKSKYRCPRYSKKTHPEHLCSNTTLFPVASAANLCYNPATFRQCAMADPES